MTGVQTCALPICYRQPEAEAALRSARAVALTENQSMILSPDRGFLSHLSQATIAATAGDIILMTDGLAAVELRYGLHAGPRDTFAAVEQAGLAAMSTALRHFERDVDPEGVVKPRWKQSDDATGLWLKFSI